MIVGMITSYEQAAYWTRPRCNSPTITLFELDLIDTVRQRINKNKKTRILRKLSLRLAQENEIAFLVSTHVGLVASREYFTTLLQTRDPSSILA
jgi:hypothetical protein